VQIISVVFTVKLFFSFVFPIAGYSCC